jgi:hypothetical protein
MRAAASEATGPAARPVGSSWRTKPVLLLFAFGRRHRALLTVVGSLATAALLAWVLASRREEFTSALSSVAAWVIGGLCFAAWAGADHLWAAARRRRCGRGEDVALHATVRPGRHSDAV